jgi:hypothetical protein
VRPERWIGGHQCRLGMLPSDEIMRIEQGENARAGRTFPGGFLRPGSDCEIIIAVSPEEWVGEIVRVDRAGGFHPYPGLRGKARCRTGTRNHEKGRFYAEEQVQSARRNTRNLKESSRKSTVIPGGRRRSPPGSSISSGQSMGKPRGARRPGAGTRKRRFSHWPLTLLPEGLILTGIYDR